MALGIILGIASAATSAYGAYSANSAKKDALAASDEANQIRAEQFGVVEGNLENLLANQSFAEGLVNVGDPVANFEALLQKYPQLIKQMIPASNAIYGNAEQQAMETAGLFTGGNIANYNTVLQALYPNFKNFQLSQEATLGLMQKQMEQANPENLGQEEILGITRKLSPLIPTGTLDPNTGAVAGGTTSPVSLYRNLISSEYAARQDKYNQLTGQYFESLSSYLSSAENSAYRQQERASSFLDPALKTYFETWGSAYDLANAGTQADIARSGLELEQFGANAELEATNIQGQYNLLSALLGMPSSQIDTSGYDAAIAAGATGAVQGLASAYNASKTDSSKSGSTTINISK